LIIRVIRAIRVIRGRKRKEPRQFPGGARRCWGAKSLFQRMRKSTGPPEQVA
jgi:hypothetical protein